MTSNRWIISTLLGSGFRGVDAGLVEATGTGFDLGLRLRHFHQLPLPDDLRELLRRANTPGAANTRQLALVHRLLGESFALAASQVAESAKTPLSQVFCLSCPGLTVAHEVDSKFPATLALGMSEVISERTGLTTISGFRTRDVLMGGQGYPLTAAVDRMYLQKPGENRVLLHLGGVATLLYLPASLGPQGMIGFQAAPCNLLLDNLMRQVTGGKESYDAGGKHAVQGCCIDSLLQRWLEHPALKRQPPRTLPRQEFGDDFVASSIHLARQNRWSLHDLLCTATHFVARATLQAFKDFIPQPIDRVLVSGGGVRNGLLWRLLENELGSIPMERIDRHGIPIDARKSVAFAGLAALALDGMPANLPSVTGASTSKLLGNFTPGSPANWARCLAWMANQSTSVKLAAA